jgi:hypothetical protein
MQNRLKEKSKLLIAVWLLLKFELILTYKTTTDTKKKLLLTAAI